MENGVTATTPVPPAAFSASQERGLVLLLCLLAAVHVFIFSAAVPFFNNVDEQIHFDLAVKYSQGHIPRSLEPISAEAIPYAVLYGSPEFVGIPANLPDGKFPAPPWQQPMDSVRQTLAAKTAAWNNVINHEASQPPLYYALAGAWWRLGKMLGFHDGPLLYWLRFLNMFFIGALVGLGYVAARLVFPGRRFLRLGVPALLAFFPQTTFYSIQNDVLSPLCFGAAFICLVKWLRADTPGVRLGTATGLALAATYLTKISNLPLLAVSGAVVLFKISRLAKAGKLRAAFPALAALALCAGLPMMAWLAWTKCHFGDFTGTAAKIQFLGWTHKSFGEWWQHPIFTPHGLWTFLSTPAGDVLAGGIFMASPAAGLAGRECDLCHFIHRLCRGGGGRPAFTFRRRDRTATAGAVVRILVFGGGGGVFWGSCPSFTISRTAFIRRAHIRISPPAG